MANKDEKHSNKKNKKKNKIIDYILYGIIIFNVFYIVDSNKLLEIGKRGESKIGVQAEDTQTNNQQDGVNISEQQNGIDENQQEDNINAEEIQEDDSNQEQDNKEELTNTKNNNEQNSTDMPAKMGGYNVLGKLVIEKINVNKNILDVSNNNSLKLSVVKLYGPEINSAGNFCICGHNWKGMLKRAKELKIGDTFYLIDRKTKNKVNYKIYNIYSCMPKELECLNQNKDGKKEVTIITCNPGGVTRLIIKGKEV